MNESKSEQLGRDGRRHFAILTIPFAILSALIFTGTIVSGCAASPDDQVADAGHADQPDQPRPDATSSDASLDGSTDAGSGADADTPEVDDISEMLLETVDDEPTPSIAAIVFGPERLEAAGAAGVRKVGDEATVTIDDRYHLGSNTKAMTATLAARLVEQELVRWDTTAAELLELENVHEAFESLTLIELLSHTSGVTGNLPQSHPELWNLMWTSEAALPTIRAHVARELLGQEPSQSSGTFAYSNAGYIIAGAMLEAATGQSWEDLMNEHLFEPLEMSSCGFGPAASGGATIDEPWHHRYLGGEAEAVPPGPAADNPGALGPAGTVHCSLPDYAKFLRIHLGGSDFVTPQNLQLLQEPVSAASGYALGWVVADRDWAGGSVLFHSGSNTMNYAVAWIAPNEQLGIVVCTNISYDNVAAALEGVVVQLVERYF